MNRQRDLHSFRLAAGPEDHRPDSPRAPHNLPDASAIEKLMEIVYANNGYNSTVVEAEGLISGKRVVNLKFAEQRLRDLLWEHRAALADLIREAQPGGRSPIGPAAASKPSPRPSR